MENYIENISYIEVKQPIGKFYSVAMKCSDLLEIANYDIRRIERDEANNIDTYFGIQRNPSQNRLKEISEYVTYVDATFPTSIVIAINTFEDEEADIPIKNISIENNKLKIRKNEKVAQILDGQHRLLGLKKAIENKGLFAEKIKTDFDLIVTIYLDMDPESQSMIFATINKAQTKVNKSLVYDLYDLANSRSPLRTAHNIVRVLNENIKSPLKDKIKMLGVADDKESETIAQATLVECIVSYISKNALRDRDISKRGEKLLLDNDNKLFFRKWFIEEKDILIARTLLNYFLAIKSKWKIAWDENTILVKSTGIIAFMKFLPKIIEKHPLNDNELTKGVFDKVLSSITLKDKDFINENFPSGGVGQRNLREILITESDLK